MNGVLSNRKRGRGQRHFWLNTTAFSGLLKLWIDHILRPL